MWEVEVLQDRYGWLIKGQIVDMSDDRAQNLRKDNIIKLIRHFRYKTETVHCECCKNTYSKQIKIYSDNNGIN